MSSRDYSQPVERPPYSAVGKQGVSQLYLGGLLLSSAGTGRDVIVLNSDHVYHGPVCDVSFHIIVLIVSIINDYVSTTVIKLFDLVHF